MIELEGVSKVYEMGGRPVHALRDVTETIDDGDYVAVMGPSGSGKSTLLNVIGCLDRPDAGEYRLDGRPVGALSDAELSGVRSRTLGFIFQTFHLIPRLSAAENVAYPMLFAGVPRPERAARVERALDAVGLADRASHRPSELSGGERQRVAIARATIMEPRVMLADEPTGNLDSRSGQQVMELLEALHADGRTLMIVTHDPEIARRANRVLLMRDGRIARRVRGDELLDVRSAAATPESA